jgi:hypothetical protein
MKTLKFFIWIMILGFFFTNCNEESDYHFPEMNPVEGQISVVSFGGDLLSAFNPENHSQLLVSASNRIIGSLSCMPDIDTEHSYLIVNKITYLPEKLLFEMDTEIKLVSFGEDGFYFQGPMYLNSNGTITGEFTLARTYGKFAGSTGTLNFTGELDFGKRVMDLDVSGFMCEIDETHI